MGFCQEAGCGGEREKWVLGWKSMSTGDAVTREDTGVWNMSPKLRLTRMCALNSHWELQDGEPQRLTH